jgi:hypothetical protein
LSGFEENLLSAMAIRRGLCALYKCPADLYLHGFVFRLGTNKQKNTPPLFFNGRMSEWEKDTIDPRPAWYFYSLVNYASVPLLLVSMYAILRSRHRQAADMFVVGEYSGCLFMSIPCATQCLLNLLGGSNAFQYGRLACTWEAFMHVSAIMVQFFSVTMIAFAHFMKVVRQSPISLNTSYSILLGMWFVGETITLAFSHISPVELLPAGTYCFYTFDSPMIYAWFIPVMSASLLAAGRIYYRIFCITRDAEKAAPSAQNTDIAHRVARRTFLFVLVFFLGWSPAVVACGYALVHGSITPTQELLVGIFGSLHSIWVPLVYGIHDEKLHRWMARYRCCRRHFPHYESRRKNKEGDKTMVKRIEFSPSPSPKLTRETLPPSSRSSSPQRKRSTLRLSDNRRVFNVTPPNPRASNTLSLPVVV